jgi:hypothetical protein
MFGHPTSGGLIRIKRPPTVGDEAAAWTDATLSTVNLSWRRPSLDLASRRRQLGRLKIDM